jgi:hypothetical protein
MQDDIRPDPLSHCENDIIMTLRHHDVTLTLGGFGQPTKGPCVELHTRDQRVRLLTYLNF